MEIDEKTIICGSISAKPSRLGALIHNAGYKALNLNYIYIPFPCHSAEGAVKGMRALGLRGIGVATPFKQQIMPFLDKIDNVAVKIGSVNTIVNNNGLLTGYNTDYIGALEALREATDPHNKVVILVGAGATARSIAYGLKNAGATVHIYNRTFNKAVNIKNDFDLESAHKLEELKVAKNFDILINAATYSQDGNNHIPLEILSKNQLIMDIIATETPLVKAATKAGCNLIKGYRMLLRQAKHQFEIYTGKKAPFKEMEDALYKTLR